MRRGVPDSALDGSRPQIAIASTASDLTPCNKHLTQVAESVKNGVWEAGGVPLVLPVVSIGETQVKPTAMLWRNMAAMAIEEMLRWTSPVKNMCRTAVVDTELHGTELKAGEKVMLMFESANFDETVFEDPFSFKVDRTPNKHIAFGYGPHVCIGKRVAQIQLEEAYRQILARFPDIRWTGEIEIAPNNFVHAISKLEVAFTPSGTA